MNKLTPFQKYAASKGVFVKGKKDDQIAVLLSGLLSDRRRGITVAVASRRSGKGMDIVVEIFGRWMHTAFDVTPDNDAVAAAVQAAADHHQSVLVLIQGEAA